MSGSDYRFRGHKYTWQKPFGSVRHQWEFVGPLGGISFSASLSDGYGTSCGLEFHRSGRCFAGPPAEAPSHTPCPLLGEPCWHDGTSLYANEQVWPYVEGCLKAGDHAAIFRHLEGEYDSHFDGRELALRLARSESSK